MTLLIPGFNDSQDEIERLTAFVAGVSADIPWHVTAFHKDYRMNDPENTTPEMLVRAAERRDGMVCATSMRATCPAGSGISRTRAVTQCQALLVERYGYFIQRLPRYRDGTCPDCRHSIPGRWGSRFEGQIASRRSCPERAGCGCFSPADSD